LQSQSTRERWSARGRMAAGAVGDNRKITPALDAIEGLTIVDRIALCIGGC
jgi:hypothetical protein